MTTDIVVADILPNLAAFGRSLRAGNRSPATVSSYAAGVRQLDDYLAAQGMPRAVASIRREHVEAFIEDILGRSRPATAANRYRSLQQLFRWLVDEGEIPVSPMAKMHPPTIPEEPPEVLRDEDIARLVKATEGTSFEDRRDRAIVRLLLDTGMRRAEIGGLRLEDIDREQGLAYVVGKGSRPRACVFDRVAGKELDRYIDRARAHHPRADEPWLWLGKKGRLGETGITQVLRRRGALAGLPGLHPHLFRHTFAHQMLAQGMQEGDLMRLAGWRSRQMVGRYGASAADERAREAYRALKDRAR